MTLDDLRAGVRQHFQVPEEDLLVLHVEHLHLLVVLVRGAPAWTLPALRVWVDASLPATVARVVLESARLPSAAEAGA